VSSVRRPACADRLSSRNGARDADGRGGVTDGLICPGCRSLREERPIAPAERRPSPAGGLEVVVYLLIATGSDDQQMPAMRRWSAPRPSCGPRRCSRSHRRRSQVRRGRPKIHDTAAAGTWPLQRGIAKPQIAFGWDPASRRQSQRVAPSRAQGQAVGFPSSGSCDGAGTTLHRCK
jgi:hypothetical protein